MALRLLYGGRTQSGQQSGSERGVRGEWGRGRGKRKGSCLPALTCSSFNSSLSEILIVAQATSQKKTEQKTTHTLGYTHTDINTHWHNTHTPVKYKLNYIFYANRADREKHTLFSRLNTASLLCFLLCLCLLFPDLLPFFSLCFCLYFSPCSSTLSTCFFSPLFLAQANGQKVFHVSISVNTAQRVYAMVSACDTLQIAGLFRPKVQKSKGAKRFPRLCVATVCRAPCCARFLSLSLYLIHSLSVYLLNSFTANPFEVLNALSAAPSTCLNYIN